MDPTIAAGYIGAVGGLLGGAVGGGIAYLAAVKSLNKAAQQAETARQAERTEARKAALLALTWELEVNEELVKGEGPIGRPNVLSHVALDAALPWYSSLPDSARNAVHKAQLALMRYNTGPRQPEPAARPIREGFAQAFAQAHTELTREL